MLSTYIILFAGGDSARITTMYQVIIKWLAPYPKEYTARIGASNAAVAVSRAIKNWRRDEVKGKRIQSFKVEVVHIPSVSTNA